MKAWVSVLLAGLGAAASLAAFSVTRDWKVLALCSLVTLLAMEQLRMIYQRAARVERLVQERTRELLEANQKLEKLNRLKDEFVSTISHELRTPLSITKEGISLVLDRIPGEINPEQESILATARGNMDRLARIINDLLDISKLEAGRVHLRREKLEIEEIFRQVAGTFGSRASAQGLSLEVRVPERLPSVYADSDKLTEILTNLVDNALKFTKNGSIRLTAKADGEWVECAVEDTGTGIAAEDLPRIFSKFEQFGRISGAGAQGTGLGLAIVKHLVELHHGEIRVESEPKKGTRFIFTLPLPPADILSVVESPLGHPSGFTLVELMIAVLLLTGGIASATFVFGRSLYATTDAELLEQGTALAQERMENLRGGSFASIAGEAKAAVSGWSGFSREVAVTQPAGTDSDFKQVVVTVYWDTTGGELSTALTSYVANVLNN